MQLYNYLTGKNGNSGIFKTPPLCYLLPEGRHTAPQADAALVTAW